MQQFTRPLPARHIEARARARAMAVRVEAVEPAGRYRSRSQTEPGVVHAQERTPVGWACTCRGFAFTGCCKHLGQVERRSEREGWAFGRVAPRPQA